MIQSKLKQGYKVALGLLAALGTLHARDALALCEQVTTTDDRGIYAAVEGASPVNGVSYGDNWVTFHNFHYNTPAEAWDHVGYRTDWNSPDRRQEFVKHVLSALVIEHGVDFEQVEPQLVRWDGQLVDVADHSQRAFHATEDYGAIARGRPPTKTFLSVRREVGTDGTIRPVLRMETAAWHLHNTLLVDENVDRPGLRGRWELTQEAPSWYKQIPVLGDFFSSKPLFSTVTTYCPVYGPAFVAGTTVNRAGVLVHEGWHSRNQPPMTSHVANNLGPQGWDRCLKDGRTCDVWYPHPKSAFGAGDAFFSRHPSGIPGSTGMPSRPPLSTYQFHSEYLCDMADNGRPWLPLTAVLAGAVSAERLFDERPFVNLDVPVYACGLPTPLYALPVGSRTNECPSYDGGQGVRCEEATECPDVPGNQIRCVSGCCSATVIR